MDGFLHKFFPVVYRHKMHAHENNYCKYNNQGLAAFTSSLYLAGLVASLLASPITRKYGRKASIMCGGISFIVGATLDASAVNLTMLILGRIMLGVGIGFGNQVSIGSPSLLQLLSLSMFEGGSAIFVRNGTGTSSRRPKHDVSVGNNIRNLHSKHDQLWNREAPAMGMEAFPGPGWSTSSSDDSGRNISSRDTQQLN